MTALPVSGLSLYQQACQHQPPPRSLQLSPATLHSAKTVLVDWLMESEHSATLLLKFPQGRGWQVTQDRLLKKTDARHRVCIFQAKPTTPDGEEEEDISQPLTSPSDILDNNFADNGESSSPVTFFSLSARNPYLRREYFLIGYTETTCGAVIAHRPRSASAQTQKKSYKGPLLTLLSLDSRMVKALVDTLMPLIPEAERAYLPSPEVQAFGNNAFAEMLWCQQIKQQEQVRRTMLSYRQQARELDTLQSENTALQESLTWKDEFINQFSQELRTPVTNMKTALSLLNSAQLKASQRERYIQALQQGCDRQNSLIEGVVELQRLETSAPQHRLEPIHLAEVIPGVVSTFQPVAQEKSISLAYTIGEELPPVACVVGWLRKIAIELLNNSIRFTPENGRIWVYTQEKDDKVVISFQDTGIGIPHRETYHIFERFYRVRHQNSGFESQGAGLGLTIVQQLLSHCGGSIAVKSQAGKGSTFTVTLPVYRDRGSVR
ncbi:ATP-binding protein [Geitlerinema sp. PCC 9228]|uniref:ATP-binding protein n=1 Tax=Geitlerinema sp. PCC 9228 TaxID=111611 RepID=UPI0008F9C1DD|nr:ATP-binding protein [Geitlerinema sp. PCC 9228]